MDLTKYLEDFFNGYLMAALWSSPADYGEAYDYLSEAYDADDIHDRRQTNA